MNYSIDWDSSGEQDWDDPLECDCADYDEDWEGRCTCGRCGRIWYKTAADMQADVERAEAFERYIRREEWKAWLLRPWRVLTGWLRPRKPATDIDDELPF